MKKNIFKNVRKNKLGYYKLINKPSQSELEKYYRSKYYQQSKGSYQNKYSPAEITFFKNKLEQKYQIIQNLFGKIRPASLKFLDIGCGEGWALAFFQEKGWNVVGLDYSLAGCEVHNPECLDKIRPGDIYKNIPKLKKEGKYFDLIFLEHVLEHVVDPLILLKDCKNLLKVKGILVVKVPNDFSILQKYLYENGHIEELFWVISPDHISYFNRQSIIRLAKAVGMNTPCIMSDFPIDWNLLNADSNYIKEKSRGRSCHQARVEIENLLHKISPQKTNKLYEIMAELGIGRNLICFFRKDYN